MEVQEGAAGVGLGAVIIAAVTTAGAIIAAAVTGWWGLLGKRAESQASSPAAMVASQADLVEALNAQTRAFVLELQKDRRELRGVVARQARSIRKLVDRVEQLEEENEVCLASGRLMALRLEAFERVLRDNGIPIPAAEMPGSLVIMEGDQRTVIRPGKPVRSVRVRTKTPA